MNLQRLSNRFFITVDASFLRSSLYDSAASFCGLVITVVAPSAPLPFLTASNPFQNQKNTQSPLAQDEGTKILQVPR